MSSGGRKGRVRGQRAGLIFWAGWCPALIVCAAVAGAGWFAAQEMRTRLTQTATNEARAVAAQLTAVLAANPDASDEAAILAGRLSELATTHGLAVCEVVDSRTGEVIARASPAAVSPRAARLSETIEQTTELPEGYTQLTVRTRPGEASAEPPVLTTFAPAAGVVFVAVIALFYSASRMHHRVRTLGLIAGALEAFGDHDRDTDALTLDPGAGPEANGWNAMLAERRVLEDRLTDQSAVEALAGQSGQGAAELQSACDALWDGLIIADASGRVLYANGAAGVLLGATDPKQITQAVEDPDTGEELLAMARSTARRRAVFDIERGEGEGRCILQLAARSLGQTGGAAIVVIVRDVTQQRVADEARSGFVAQATHELRTPLTNIRLYAEEAAESGQDDPGTMYNAINVINQESRRLERIVGDMLSVSEIEAGSLSLNVDDVRLEQIFNDMRAEFAGQAKEKSIELEWDLPPKLPVLRGDRDKIVLAVHNIVGNALKYTPEEGTVTVRVDASETGFTCEVADSGLGIDPDEQDRVFEKFYRAKDRRIAGIAGSGLGLALAREVVRLHGGDITLESVVGEGSTFSITVPTLGDRTVGERAPRAA